MYCVVLFYKYVPLSREVLSQLEVDVKRFTESYDLKGRLLLAEEGINGTVAGEERCVKEFTIFVSTLVYCSLGNIDWKYSFGDGELPFVDMYIKEAKELISTGDAKDLINDNIFFQPESFGGIGGTGKHLKPKEFHEALSHDPHAVVLDIRNDFEYDVGHFEGAHTMNTNTFSETWRTLDSIIANLNTQSQNTEDSEGSVPQAGERNFYMYCTGGIRCEKASVYLRAKGYDNVFQLEGGIHRYLEEYPGRDSKFLGRNFVFDSRMIENNNTTSNDSQIKDSCRKIIGKCIDCNAEHDTYTSDQRCVVCRQPLLVCPKCKFSQSFTKFNEQRQPEHDYVKDHHCKNHSSIYGSALQNQLDALRLLEKDYEFTGRGQKKRRKTIRNQIDKIIKEQELRDSVLSPSDEKSNSDNRKQSPNIVGGIWGL